MCKSTTKQSTFGVLCVCLLAANTAIATFAIVISRSRANVHGNDAHPARWSVLAVDGSFLTLHFIHNVYFSSSFCHFHRLANKRQKRIKLFHFYPVLKPSYI